MRFEPLHPRQLMVLAMSTLALMLVLMLAAVPDLGTVDFSIGGGGGAAPVAEAEAPATAAQPAAPAWVGDPLASPVEALRAPATP